MDIDLLFAGDFVYKKDEHLDVDSFLMNEFKNAHVFSVNMEAPLEGKGMPIKKMGPVLNQNRNAVIELLKLGVNVINCANNHIYDYGQDALTDTLEKFPDSITIGAGKTFEEAYRLKLKTINGINIGLLSFAENGYGAICNETDLSGYAWINHPKTNDIVRDSATQCDVLIIQVHAGVEEMDMPLPEWRRRYKELVDLGASAIIASHPHVPQGWEMYKNAPIFYSLGNFYFDMDSSHPLWNKGIIAKLTIGGGGYHQNSFHPYRKRAE